MHESNTPSPGPSTAPSGEETRPPTPNGPPAQRAPRASQPPPGAPATGRERRGSRWWVWVLVAFVLLALVSCAVWPVFVVGLGMLDDGYTGSDGVALIHIDAMIAGVGAESALGGTVVTPEYVIDQLRRADDDPGVRAILLRIDSGGGTVAASQEIAMEVARTDKPVVVSGGDIVASGAYWIASQADYVMAAPSTAVGSIGVIAQIPNVQELFDELGVEMQTITKGEFKDVGSPYRSLDATETALIEENMQVYYDMFIEGVAEGRDMEVAEVEELASGWYWPAAEAVDMGLVDGLGNYQDAVEKAGELGGIEGEPVVVPYDEPSPFEFFSWLLADVGGLRDVTESLRNGSRPVVPR